MIGVDNAAGCGAAVSDRHVQRVHDKSGVLAGVDGPANDPAAEGIQDCGAVDPAFSRVVHGVGVGPQRPTPPLITGLPHPDRVRTTLREDTHARCQLATKTGTRKVGQVSG